MTVGFTNPIHAENVLSIKDDLAKRGMLFEFSETVDFVSNFQGGLINKSTFIGLGEVSLTFDATKLGLWQGGKLFVHGTNAHGQLKPTGEMVGDLQAVNNNEAPRTTRLYEIWYEHLFLNENFSVLMGIHDLNADFMVSQNAALYLNGAFGVPTTLTSNVSASVYPLAGPGFRVKLSLGENTDILAGVYDGDLGDADINTHSTHYAIKEHEGILSLLEVARHFSLLGHQDFAGIIKVGGWYHSGNFADNIALDGNGDAVPYDDNYGGYVMLDQRLYQEHEDQGLDLFVMASLVPKNRNAIQRHLAMGMNYTGLIPSRDQDVLGLAVTQSYFSGSYREANNVDPYEMTLEGTYHIRVNDYLSIQPDMQYVYNPSGNKDIKHASVFTLRSVLNF